MTDTTQTRGTFLSALMDCLVARAVDGVARVTRTEMRRLTGISERALGKQIEKLALWGAIETIPGPGPTSPMAYRIVNPAIVNDQSMWSVARVVLIREQYADHWNPALTATLNALPGPRLMIANVKDWAGNHGLKKSAALLATRPAPRVRVRSPRVPLRPAPVRETPVASPARKSMFPVTRSVFHFRGTAALVEGVPPSHSLGRCRWPLTCSEPTARVWCAEHAGLLNGKRAA